jgi:endo-1,4-beta-xylanase
LINTLKSRNIRIDAIGMQGHIGMDGPSIEEYEEAILAYSKAGVKVMVTELDLSILPPPRRGVGADISTNIEYQQQFNPYTEGVPDEAMQAWTNRMLDFFKLFIKHQDKVTRVTMWGVSDGGSWKNGFPVRGRTDYPLLFDRSHQAKPVVNEIIKLAHNIK